MGRAGCITVGVLGAIGIALAVWLIHAAGNVLNTPPGASAAGSTPPSAATLTVGGSSAFDLPQFDQAGTGNACVMTYGPGGAGGVVTVFTLGEAGTLVTHVDGPGGQHIHTQAEPKGPVSFGYGFPLGQVSGMGAVFYPDSGGRVDCAIGPAR